MGVERVVMKKAPATAPCASPPRTPAADKTSASQLRLEYRARGGKQSVPLAVAGGCATDASQTFNESTSQPEIPCDDQ